MFCLIFVIDEFLKPTSNKKTSIRISSNLSFKVAELTKFPKKITKPVYCISFDLFYDFNMSAFLIESNVIQVKISNLFKTPHLVLTQTLLTGNCECEQVTNLSSDEPTA